MTLLLALLGCWSDPAPEPTKPAVRAPGPPPTAIEGGKTSVLVVLLDTVRADNMGLYGYDIPTSPNLDALGAKSVVFDQHMANCSWTRPSMGSMLTGHHPRTLGLYEERYDRLDASFELLSEHFDARGYVTLGTTSNPNMNDIFGFQQGFDAYSESGVAFGWMQEDAKEGKVAFSREQPLEDARTMTDRSLALIDAHGEQLKDAPFYLQVVYIDPHWPYVQPKEHEEAVAGSKKPGYDGGIHFVDAQVQRLLDGLEARGHLQDTLVVITGDHGEGLWSHPGEPNAAWHGNTLYDSVLHVPLILSHPTLQPRRVEALTEGIDLVPTVVDLLGWPVPEGLPGQSLATATRGEGPAPTDRYVFSETDFRQNLKTSVRTATHKLIRNDDVQLFQQGLHEGRELKGQDRQQLEQGQPWELYVLGEGLEVTRNSRPDLPIAEELRAKLEAWEAATPRRAPIQHDPDDVVVNAAGEVVSQAGGDAVDLDEATKRALEAIGYLEE